MTADAQPTADPRHAQRMHIVQQLYAYSFDPQFMQSIDHQVDREVEAIVRARESLDGLVQAHAPKYPIDQIAKTDLAILRLALYELTIKKQEPTKVVINEAIELAKEMGSDRSYAFINAVLGAVVSDTTH